MFYLFSLSCFSAITLNINDEKYVSSPKRINVKEIMSCFKLGKRLNPLITHSITSINAKINPERKSKIPINAPFSSVRNLGRLFPDFTLANSPNNVIWYPVMINRLPAIMECIPGRYPVSILRSPCLYCLKHSLLNR